ncbi:MAG: glycosyltransferase family 39 protein [Candidatus Omnitrophica bacterium]|nr:glycosyltransferase family 39 protein [Candidatus Omnitrophota bacterium]
MSKKAKIVIILAGIILFHLMSNYIWLQNDTTYLIHDSHHHFLFSYTVYDVMKEGMSPLFNDNLRFFQQRRWHGVFVQYCTAPFYFLFGADQDSGVMINSTIFFVILILSTYGIGKTFSNEQGGVLSAFMVSMYPLIFNHLKVYMLDLPLTSMVALSVYLLMRTDNFSKRVMCLLFAISFAFGILTKVNCLLFVGGPLLYVLLQLFLSKQYRNNRVYKNLFICVLLVSLLSFSFLFFKWKDVLSRIYGSSWLNLAYFPYRSLTEGIFAQCARALQFIGWSIAELSNYSVSVFFFIIFLYSLINRGKAKHMHDIILFIWILLPLAVLAIVFRYPNDARYLMPILPPIAIISARGIVNIKQTLLRMVVLSLVVVFGCIQYFAISFGIPLKSDNKQIESLRHILSIFNGSLSGIVLMPYQIPIVYRNDQDNFSYPIDRKWPYKRIIETISKNKTKSNELKYIFFVDIIPEIYDPLNYLFEKDRLPFGVRYNSIAEEFNYEGRKTRIDDINKYAYVALLDKPDKENIDSFIRELITTQRNVIFNNRDGRWKQIDAIDFHEDNKLYIFKNNSNL